MAIIENLDREYGFTKIWMHLPEYKSVASGRYVRSGEYKDMSWIETHIVKQSKPKKKLRTWATQMAYSLADKDSNAKLVNQIRRQGAYNGKKKS